MILVRAISHDRGFAAKERTALTTKDSHCLTMMAYGKCLYRIGNGSVPLEKGDFLFVPAAVGAIQGEVSENSHEKITIEFTHGPESGAPTLPLLAAREPVKWNSGKTDYYMARLLRLCEHWSEKEAYYEYLCSALLLETLASLNREIDKGPFSPSSVQHVNRMKIYIDERYRDKITKHDLGDRLRLSPNYAASLFRQVTGYTISEYVHRRRIKAAQYLLRHSRLTVQDISDSLGYCDPSFFHRTFTKLTGRLPSELLAERNREED